MIRFSLDAATAGEGIEPVVNAVRHEAGVLRSELSPH
jgi:hypothetical protein